MRCVVQKVTQARVLSEGELTGEIGAGYMVLCGAEIGDTEADAEYCANKISGLRIFEDAEEKMNLSLEDVGGAVLMVSQFTLMGDARKGRRPAFITAERPERAEPLFELVCEKLRAKGLKVETGRFRTHMEVSLTNDGPTTILLDSRRTF